MVCEEETCAGGAALRPGSLPWLGLGGFRFLVAFACSCACHVYMRWLIITDCIVQFSTSVLWGAYLKPCDLLLYLCLGSQALPTTHQPAKRRGQDNGAMGALIRLRGHKKTTATCTHTTDDRRERALTSDYRGAMIIRCSVQSCLFMSSAGSHRRLRVCSQINYPRIYF